MITSRIICERFGRELLANTLQSTHSLVEGFVLDPLDPNSKFVVELTSEGVFIALARAEMYHHALRMEGYPSDCCGFAIRLPVALRGSPMLPAEVRLANDGAVLGRLVLGDISKSFMTPPGAVKQTATGQLEGWLRCDPSLGDLSVKVVCRGQIIAEVPVNGWSYQTYLYEPGPTRSFKVLLPLTLFNKIACEIDVLDQDDNHLLGSPIQIAPSSKVF